jgi:hypothetical protein
MSGNCTCNQIQAASKGRGIICNRKAVKAPAIRDLRNTPWGLRNIGIITHVKRLRVSAYTKTDGTHTTTAGMCRTETPLNPLSGRDNRLKKTVHMIRRIRALSNRWSTSGKWGNLSYINSSNNIFWCNGKTTKYQVCQTMLQKWTSSMFQWRIIHIFRQVYQINNKGCSIATTTCIQMKHMVAATVMDVCISHNKSNLNQVHV